MLYGMNANGTVGKVGVMREKHLMDGLGVVAVAVAMQVKIIKGDLINGFEKADFMLMIIRQRISILARALASHARGKGGKSPHLHCNAYQL